MIKLRDTREFLKDWLLLPNYEAAEHLVGMPPQHARIFSQIARQEKCIISSRQIGRVCTGLVTEGYDTKGFRMKSKSCDFGPMAGFICLDERLHKKGAAYNKKQKEDIDHGLHGDEWDTTGQWKASTEQICLTENRLQELINWKDDENKGALIKPQAVAGRDGVLRGTVTEPVKVPYVLMRETRHDDDVWALYYSPPAVVFQAGKDILDLELKAMKPIKALVNPYPPYPAGHYKNCCTGDYDLFGVWPKKKRYDALGEDRRIAGMSVSPVARERDQQTFDWEDLRLGNISNRIHTVAQMINSLLHSELKGGQGPARDMIHHSDEAGRPCVSGIDDHTIAFIPGPKGQNYIVGAESPGGRPNPTQWAAFFRMCDNLGYQVILNTAWKAQMAQWGVGHIGTTGDARGWREPKNSRGRST